jgi:putative transcriptional regulator
LSEEGAQGWRIAVIDDMDLTGKLLIAMPGMGDPRFGHSVVFLCAHSDEGAMGLIVNKPTGDLTLADLLQQLEIDSGPQARQLPVHFGGPVEHGRGFVLHERGYRSSISTLEVSDGFAMTATLDILEDMAQGSGPARALVALGYAGWGPGQLEGEIAQNGWLVCDATHELVFDAADAGKWEGALTSLGISPLTLSSEAGHA